MTSSNLLNPPGNLPQASGVKLDWEPLADEVLAAIVASIEPRLRKASEDIYADLVYAAQDYLADNVKFNIASRIAAADAQALYDRQRAMRAEGYCAEAASLLRSMSQEIWCASSATAPRLRAIARILVDDAGEAA